MPSYNKAILIGNLARDVESKVFPQSGNTAAKFTVAVNRKYQQNGETKEEVTFVDVRIFGKTAENCAKYLAKGSSVLVDGRLKLEQWETKNGDKRSALVVIAETVQFLSSKNSRAQSSERDETPSPHQVSPQYAPPPMPSDDAPAVSDDIPF